MKTTIKKILKKLFPNTFGKSVSRISLDIELKRQFKKLKPGIILDVGSKHSPYLDYIPHNKYVRLDIDKKNKPDICCDLHKIEWESNYFDTVIATEVLEHLYNPQKAIEEIYRILKPGGVCILSTRFIYAYHPDPQDYYRYTWDSLKYLFRKFNTVEVFHHGNRIQALWQIISDCGNIGIPIRLILNPVIGKIHFKKTRYPCGFIIYAKK
jgi:SAM-dependent methyltransferase